MNTKQIKALETELWDAADNLRANSKLTAAEYKDPVLGLILLRYAQNRFDEVKPQVATELNGLPLSLIPDLSIFYRKHNVLYIPEQAQYDYLANLPEDADIQDKVNEAMRLIETNNTDLAGVLPKDYQNLEADLLRGLLRLFNKDAIKNLTGDVFGRIYEFFLMKFSMSGAGAQEGGEFFTPPSLVQLIVDFIRPDHGIIHDPACGSGGMFVQTGYFIREKKHQSVNETVRVCGTELKQNNARLAKMNLAIHGIEGDIIESNSFYTDPHTLTLANGEEQQGLVGACDFVMANPPFNVNKIDKARDWVKQDKRLFADVGIPNADNGNYLWIQYFYHYLNDKGRAGFVMASSATDAGSSEKLIRQKLIQTQAVDCIVSIGNNFFYTRSLPCHVWFLDKGKREANKDKILMIDARNTFRQINQTLRDFSTGQHILLNAIMAAYRGNSDFYTLAQSQFAEHLNGLWSEVNEAYTNFVEVFADAWQKATDLEDIKKSLTLPTSIGINTISDLASAQALSASYTGNMAAYQALFETIKAQIEANKQVETDPKTQKETIKNKKAYDAQNRAQRLLTGLLVEHNQGVEDFIKDSQQANNDWSAFVGYFPAQTYQDIEGLCKIVTTQEVKDNDWSLTPGRYVGYTIEIDHDFDYQTRLTEIHAQLATLNNEANSLMQLVLGVRV
jgi:type I restriction enzyme M protein